MKQVSPSKIDSIIAAVPIAKGQISTFRAYLESGDYVSAVHCVPRGMGDSAEVAQNWTGLSPRLAFLAEMSELLNDEEYAHVLRIAWTTAEKYVDEMVFKALFRRSNQGGAILGIIIQEQQFLDGQADPFPVYRGCTESTRHGYCWTTNHDKAQEFAATHAAENDEPGEVIARLCPKAAVRAIYHNVGEFEVVVDHADLLEP
jgi:hypothetical protein